MNEQQNNEQQGCIYTWILWQQTAESEVNKQVYLLT